MRVFLTTLGCRLNEAELATWSRSFGARGHEIVDAPHRAELVVVNTCAVTSEAARKSRKLVSGLHRKNPTAKLVVTGCFAALEPERAAALAGVDLVVGNRDKDRLVDEVTARIDPDAMPVRATEPHSLALYPDTDARGSHTRAFIKVQDGCRNKCSFCIVTVARGEERSRRVADLVAEVQALTERGYAEAVLTGVHLGGYGSDLGTDLRALVRALLAHTDIPRLRLSSLEPWDLPQGFAALWENPRLMPHLHLPLQSGSDSVLRRMSRRCSTARYEALVADLRGAIPALSITTDVIVGFPGEDEREWAETVATVERIGFAHMHVFSYSAREGTRAATLPGRVSAEVKRARSRQLHAIAARMKAAHLARAVGTTRPILWERASEPTPAGRRYAGYTDDYLRAQTTVARGVELGNRITNSELVAIADGVLVAEPPTDRSFR